MTTIASKSGWGIDEELNGYPSDMSSLDVKCDKLIVEQGKMSFIAVSRALYRLQERGNFPNARAFDDFATTQWGDDLLAWEKRRRLALLPAVESDENNKPKEGDA